MAVPSFLVVAMLGPQRSPDVSDNLTVQHLRGQTFTQSPVVGTAVSSGQAVFRAGAGVVLVPRLPAAILTALIPPLCEHTRRLSSEQNRRFSSGTTRIFASRFIEVHVTNIHNFS